MTDTPARPWEPLPPLQRVLDDLNRIGNPLDRLTRENVGPFWLLREALARNILRPIPVALVRDVAVPARNRVIPVRIYDPSPGAAARPVVVYFHGGGWTLGSIAAYDSLCRALAQGSGAMVVSVDYRLAPECPFPAGIEDAYLALEWVARNAADLGADPARILTAGDSAGGTFATVTALLGRKAGISIVHQVLLYPCVQVVRTDYPSYRQYAEGYWLSRKGVETFREFYLPDRASWEDFRVSPLLMPEADLARMPPAWVLTCGCDVLRDEGAEYVQRLQSAGVKVVHRLEERMIHAGLNLFNGRAYPEASQCVEPLVAAVAEAIGAAT